MKRLILVSVLLVAMSISVSAIYDPNGTHTNRSDDGPQILKASSPPEYQIDLKQEKPTCGTAEAGNVSITSVNASSEEANLSLEGSFQTPNPCHELNRELKKTGNQRYVLNITDQKTSDTCMKCIGNINYEVNLTVPETGVIFEIHHNEEKMAKKQIPETSNTDETSENTSVNESTEEIDEAQEESSEGLIQGILGALRGLF